MPKQANYAKFFSTYLAQEVDEDAEGENQLDCPFCEKEKHFYAECNSGLWHCKRCDESGNALTLITKIHAIALETTGEKQWKFLEKKRHISFDTFRIAGFAYDDRNDRWLVPYFTYDPQTGTFSEYLNNLGYFYPSAIDPKSQFAIHKGATLPTYLYNPGLHYFPHYSEKAIICEGEWDTLAYYDMNPDTEDLVLGKPGSGFNLKHLQTLEKCKELTLLLDNDAPGRKQTAGAIRVIQQATKKKIYLIDWALVPDAPKDIRDMTRVKNAPSIIQRAIVPYDSEAPDEVPEGEHLTAGYVRDAEAFDHVRSFQRYIQRAETMLQLSTETKRAMAATIGITISYDIPGEPLWAFLNGPPASGKTTFIESFGGTNQWFDNLSKITAESFVSGWRDDTGDEPSYLPNLRNKTLFVKDFTTTLTGPIDAQRKVFGLLTDIYDGHVKIHYGNNQMREFHDIYFNMVAGVTDIIHSQSQASIGERFFKIDWLGQGYNAREYAMRALDNFGGTKINKKELTANTLGFVRHLREQTIDMNIPMEFRIPIVDLAEFISIVRTKVETDRFEGLMFRPRSELPTRLAKQLAKLFVATTVVTGSQFEAFQVVRKVALDTCYGFALDIVKLVGEHKNLTREDISSGVKLDHQRAYRVLNDLTITGVLATSKGPSGPRGGNGKLIYKLNDKLLPALYPDQHLHEPLVRGSRTKVRANTRTEVHEPDTRRRPRTRK